MKITSSSMLANTATTILSGILASNYPTMYGDDACIDRAISLAWKLLDAIPEQGRMPSDEDIKAACHELIPEEGEIGAALLGDGFCRTFNVHRGMSYTIAQKAEQLGIIKPKKVGKNKMVYTLA